MLPVRRFQSDKTRHLQKKKKVSHQSTILISSFSYYFFENTMPVGRNRGSNSSYCRYFFPAALSLLIPAIALVLVQSLPGQALSPSVSAFLSHFPPSQTTNASLSVATPPNHPSPTVHLTSTVNPRQHLASFSARRLLDTRTFIPDDTKPIPLSRHSSALSLTKSHFGG